jgi:transposase
MPMMGIQPEPQGKLFFANVNMEGRVRSNHPLRKIVATIDFDFAYEAVKDKYGNNGNESVPPPVLLKLMLLLVFYNVRSERELMDTLPERLDWLWFLGYDLESETPNHSVLSKARKRWGEDVFKEFFERIVLQCVQAGLVDGRKIFMDSSLVEADASCNSVVDTQSLKYQVTQKYSEFENRLEDVTNERYVRPDSKPVNRRYLSSTDPDAALVRRNSGTSKPRYQVHRAVDGQSEVITATEVTSGEINEAHRLEALVDQHHDNTKRSAETVVADSKYGTIENFLACSKRGLQAHISDLGATEVQRASKRPIFPASEFKYDPVADTYQCPAGNQLHRKSIHEDRQSIDYAATAKVCGACALREKCTNNKSGRSIKRHFRQDELDRMRERSRSWISQRDIRIRQHLMERSFARAQRYGFARMRWRRLWRVRIQEYLTAVIQNIGVLVRYGRGPNAVGIVLGKVCKNTLNYFENFFRKFSPLPAGGW